jgi:hypothetical protein
MGPHRANAIAAWFIAIIATCLLVAPVVAGDDDDASHFMVCRPGECVDLPSMRIIPRLETPVPTPPAANADTPLIPGEPAPDHLPAKSKPTLPTFATNTPMSGSVASWRCGCANMGRRGREATIARHGTVADPRVSQIAFPSWDRTAERRRPEFCPSCQSGRGQTIYGFIT